MWHFKKKNTQKARTPKKQGPGEQDIPQQLIVPVSIGTWNGKAIVDTGASYTLVHDSVWKALRRPQEDLTPWTSGPLFLANGETETPLGWVEMTIDLSHNPCTLPVAVLSPKALAYRVVLGLDYLCLSGLQIHAADRKPETYLFHDPTLTCGVQPALVLLTSVPPPCLVSQPVNLTSQDYIDLAVANADLEKWDKASLRQLLESKPDLCSLKPGKTDVLQHHIYTDTNVPIKQKAYRMSLKKQQIVEQQLKSMLDEG